MKSNNDNWRIGGGGGGVVQKGTCPRQMGFDRSKCIVFMHL